MSNDIAAAPTPPAEAQAVGGGEGVYAALRSIRYNAANGSQDRPVHVRLHLIEQEAKRAIVAIEAGMLTALSAQPRPASREADRERFSDPAFQRWLDEGISDSGHTVWDAVGDVAAAWAGWEARQFAGDAVLIAECCGREECGGECGNEWRGMGMYRKPTGDGTAPQPASAPVGVEGMIETWRHDIAARIGPVSKADLRPQRFLRDLEALAQQPAAVDAANIGRAFLTVLADPSVAWRDTGAQPFIDRVAALAQPQGEG